MHRYFKSKLFSKKVFSLSGILILLAATVVGVGLVQRQQTIKTEAQTSCTHYIATNGNDNNSGTSLNSPWRTISKANSSLQAGNTVCIRGGTYNERIVPSRSGTSGSKITYKNYQNETPVVRGEAGVKTIVTISSKNYIVIDGLTIKHQNTAGWKERYFLVMVQGGSNNNEIKNCRIIRDGDPAQLTASNMKERGIQVSSGSNNLIENNNIRGVNMAVVVGSGSSYTTIKGNTFTEIGQSPIDFSGKNLGHNLVENNILEWSAIEDGIQFEHNYNAPEPSTAITDHYTIIRNNIIRNNAENALDFKGAANILVEGNIIYGTIGSNNGPIDERGWNRGSHVTITRGANASTRDIIIRNNLLFDNSAGMNLYDGYRAYNNTVVGNNRDYTGPNSTYTWDRKPMYWGIRQMQGKVGVQNNIVIGHNVVEVAMRPGAGSGYINNNLYFNTKGLFFTDYRTTNDWEKMSFSQWKNYLNGKSSISGNDSASIVANPKFTNAPERPVGNHEQYNFHLQSSSPAIDKGGPLTRTNGAGSGKSIKVDDARYFIDGYGIVNGDLIKVGSNNPVRITDVNFSTNTLTLASSITWKDNDWVNLPYQGSAPDIGAYEYGGTSTPPPTTTPTSPPTSTPTPTSTSTPPPSTPTPSDYLLGDLDQDGDVDTDDYNQLVADFGVGGTSSDIDGGGEVTIFDYAILVGNFGKTQPTPTPSPTPVFSGGENVIKNHSFEEGSVNWRSNSNGSMSFSVTDNSNQGDKGAELTINEAGTSVQFYQPGITLEPNTAYSLSFDAYSNTGHDLSLVVHKHGSPYTNYGLSYHEINLDNSWQTHSVEFTTKNFSSTVKDARLRFWLSPYDAAGDIYYIDNVVLRKTN